tara:strand:+ start:119 stop:652 length:534 start_codon:yes stop_codon:yes gene_type:complete
MACDITAGRNDSNCLDSLGGIKAIYVANFAKGMFADATFTGEEITAMGSAYDVFKYELRGTNNIDEANTKDINAGTSIFEASGTITLKKQDATTQAQMVLLSKGRPQIIAEGYDGSFRIFGIKNGVDVTVNTASGADMNEFNGYTLTLASKEDNLAYFVASSLVAEGAATGFDVQTN